MPDDILDLCRRVLDRWSDGLWSRRHLRDLSDPERELNELLKAADDRD